MNFTTERGKMRGFRTVCAISAFVFAATACTSDTSISQLNLVEPQSTQIDTVQLASSGLKLLQSAKPRTVATRPTRSAVGSGSYICSPAGFDQPSRCYSNLYAGRVFGSNGALN
jgi:hypothetical protein